MSGAAAPLRIEHAEHVLIITLTRPDKRNAVNRQLADALDDALTRLEVDDDLWLGLLAAEGPVFCAGSDLTANGDYDTERGGEYGIIRRRRDKPLIAVVEGPALGGGFEIVLACDLVVASEGARFGLPEVSRGLVPACGGLFRGPRALPPMVARELVVTGDPIDARRAYELGLVNAVVAPGQSLDEARRLAERICRNSPSAVRASLRAIDDVLAADDDTGWAATERAKHAVGKSRDRAEGIAAFLEKRVPRWSGR